MLGSSIIISDVLVDDTAGVCVGVGSIAKKIRAI
jgi:hypothetical protein